MALTYEVDVKTSNAIKSIDDLRTSINGLISLLSAKAFIDFADAITTINNRLVTLAPNAEVAAKQFQAIASIALTARTPLTETAALFDRVNRASGDLGISQRQAAQVTESLAKALSASGMSSREAAGPLLQFGQALQSGVFQGDELRSILEGLPPVSKALADSLGVPVGALKDFGSKGMISADLVVKAMLQARDAIDEAFAKTTPTISQAFTSVRTAAAVVFNNFEQNTKTGQTFALSIEYIAVQLYAFSKNIDAVVEKLSLFFKIAGIIVLFTAFGKVLSMIEGIFLGIIGFGGRVVALFESIVAGVPALTQALSVLRPLLAAIGSLIGIDMIVKQFEDLKDSSSDTRKEFEANKKAMLEAAGALDDTAKASANAAYQQQKLAEKLALVRLESNQNLADLRASLDLQSARLKLDAELIYKDGQLQNLSRDNIEIQKTLFDLETQRTSAVKKLRDEADKLAMQLGQIPKGLQDSPGAKELSGRIGIIRDQIAETNKLYDQQREKLPQLIRNQETARLIDEDRNRTLQNMITAIDEQIKRYEKIGDITRSNLDKQREIGFEQAQLGRSPLERQIAQIQENARKGALAAGRAFADTFGSADLTPEKAQELADGLSLIEKQFKAISDAQIANLQSSRTWEQGWRDAFNTYVDNATNAAAQAKSVFDKVTKGFEDAIVNFVKTGKLSFKDLANTIIEEMTRAQVRKFIGNFAGGDVLGGLFQSILGFANGGIIPTNGPVIVGERGPEIIAGAAGRNVIPNDRIGSTQVVYNINAVDAPSFKAMLARDPTFLYSLTEQGRKSLPSTRR